MEFNSTDFYEPNTKQVVTLEVYYDSHFDQNPADWNWPEITQNPDVFVVHNTSPQPFKEDQHENVAGQSES